MMASIEIEGVTDGPEFIAKLYRTKNLLGRQKWRFAIVAKNGEIVATSETYRNRSDAEDIARRLVGRVRTSE